MKFLLILIILFAVFAVESHAQLCGTYRTTLKIATQTGKPLANLKIKIIPLQQENSVSDRIFVPEKTDASRFTISFQEGYIVKGKYKVQVSALGYVPAEKELTFSHCASRIFEVALKPKSAKSVSDFRDIIRINGEIFAAKSRVGFVEITAVNKSGRNFKTKADENGYYQLELPLGDYELIYQKPGYHPLKVLNVGIKELKNIYLYSVDLSPIRENQEIGIIIKDFKDLYKSRDVY